MRWILGLLLCFWPLAGLAETGSLFASSGGALFQPVEGERPTTDRASLFAGLSGGGLFAPISRASGGAPHRDAVTHLRYIIGQAESPRDGYDAVQHGARIKPAKPPTHMTLAEIFAWIEATPNQPHAIGRYQFIPDTLSRVVQQVGAGPNDRFTPALQDRLADVLLSDAGFAAFMAGELSEQKFMNNLAAIWAGLPTSSGRSKYHGVAGNRATVTLAYFQAEIAKIRPG